MVCMKSARGGINFRKKYFTTGLPTAKPTVAITMAAPSCTQKRDFYRFGNRVKT